MRLKRPSGVMTALTVMGEWRYGQKYELEVDSAAVTGLSGQVNNKFKLAVNVGKEADYGSLFLHLPGADITTTVQLLKSDSNIERQVRIKGGRADFFYLQPGTYYLRCFVDGNLNGCWDTGDYAAGLQPEAVYYFPHPLK